MQPIAICYSTKHGQTRKVADYVAEALRRRGAPVEIYDLAGGREPPLDRCSGVVLAGSVHYERHLRDLTDFILKNRGTLSRLPTALLSVSGAAGTASRAELSPEARADGAASARRVIDRLVNETGFRPQRVELVAGAIAYTRYNFLMRWMMKSIARRTGGPTDTSRDHEFTDWAALERFADEFLADVEGAQPTPPQPEAPMP